MRSNQFIATLISFFLQFSISLSFWDTIFWVICNEKDLKEYFIVVSFHLSDTDWKISTKSVSNASWTTPYCAALWWRWNSILFINLVSSMSSSSKFSLIRSRSMAASRTCDSHRSNYRSAIRKFWIVGSWMDVFCPISRCGLSSRWGFVWFRASNFFSKSLAIALFRV